MKNSSDFSGVFKLDEDSDKTSLQSYLSIRLEELETITGALAECPDITEGEIQPIIWHLFHSLHDVRTVFSAFSDKIFPLSQAGNSKK